MSGWVGGWAGGRVGEGVGGEGREGGKRRAYACTIAGKAKDALQGFSSQ